jgi:hypothetical protein
MLGQVSFRHQQRSTQKRSLHSRDGNLCGQNLQTMEHGLTCIESTLNVCPFKTTAYQYSSLFYLVPLCCLFVLLRGGVDGNIAMATA